MKCFYKTAFLAALLCLMLVNRAHALVLTVTPNSDNDCAVDNDCDLQAALNAAQTHTAAEDDIINIAAGTYHAPQADGFRFTGADNENGSLVLQGAGASVTFLERSDPNLDGRVMLIDNLANPDFSRDIVIRNLSIRGGNHNPTAGLELLSFNGHILIENCHFSENRSNSADGGALSLFSPNGFMALYNNLFQDNFSSQRGSAAFLFTMDGSLAVAHNTFVRNSSTTNQNNGSALFIRLFGNGPDSQAVIFNNLFFDNLNTSLTSPLGTENDLSIDELPDADDVGVSVELRNNNLAALQAGCGSAQTTCDLQLTSLNNQNVDPLFANAEQNDFRLSATSPLRDQGLIDTVFPSPAFDHFPLPTLDLDGNLRLQGEAPDPGAYELSLVENILCGNGIVDSEEECDDDNDSNEDACLSTCKKATCGDGFVQQNVEECDPLVGSQTATDLSECNDQCHIITKSSGCLISHASTSAFSMLPFGLGSFALCLHRIVRNRKQTKHPHHS